MGASDPDAAIKLALRVTKEFNGGITFRELIRSSRLLKFAVNVLVESQPKSEADKLLEEARKTLELNASADEILGDLQPLVKVI